MPGKKKKSAVKAEQALVQRLEALAVSRKPKKRKRKSVVPGRSSLDGEVRFSRCEFVTELKTDAAGKANGHITITPESFSFLNGFGACFDRTRWLSCSFHYKPAVGTTIGGLVSMGVDWDFSSNATDRKKISGLSPNASLAVWSDTTRSPLVLPASRLMSRDWYSNATKSTSVAFDTGPGQLSWAVSAPTAVSTVVGEIWCNYSVVMSGTNPK